MTTDKNDSYMGSGTVLKRAQNKYGIENFSKEILFECKDEEEMNKKEKEIVNDVFIKRLDTYNLNEGGSGSWSYVNSVYTSDKRSDDMKKMYSCERARKRVSDAVRRYQAELKEKNPELYEYRKQKSMEALKKFKDDHPTFYADHKRIGWHHTEDAKNKMSKAKRGNKNGMYGKRWVVNFDERINKLINSSENIPDGFVLGRCYDFDKQEKKKTEYIVNTKAKKEKRDNISKELKEYYTAAVILYNEVGFKKMSSKIGYTKSKTNFFTMSKKYSDVKLKRVNKSEHRKHKALLPYSFKLRHMSKDERIKFYEEVYEVYKDGGFDAVVEKYDYPNTRNALLGSFKMYVSSYVPTKCNRWG